MNGKFSISDIDNYRSKLEPSLLKTYATRYTNLVCDFLLYAAENIVIRNSRYYAFVVQRGLETLRHIFRILLLYTRNVDLTVHHCKKAYYYYVEFIGQIGDDSHSYLQLNSKDATLFVYKKTIYEISTAHRTKFSLASEEGRLLEVLCALSDVLHEITTYIIRREVLKGDKKESVLHFAIERASKILGKITVFNCALPEHLDKINMLLFVVRHLQTYGVEVLPYSEICLVFARRLRKKAITIQLLQDKFHSTSCEANLESHTPLRFVNWLFSN